MDFKTFTILTLIYLIPAYLFYLIFIIELFRKSSKELKTPFFNLIKLLGIIDLIFVPMHLYIYRIGHFETLWPYLEKFSEKNLPMTIVQWLFCVFQHSQFIVHFLLALNRFSAVTQPNKYKIYWASRHFWKYCVFTIVTPMIYMSWLLYFGGHMYYLEGYNYMVDSYKTYSNLLKKSTFCVVIGSVTCIIAFIMDLSTFIYINRKTYLEYNKHIRLLGVSIVILFTSIVYMFFEFFYILPFVVIFGETALFQLLILITDIQSLISPFCNIALNPYLRQSLFRRRLLHNVIRVQNQSTSIVVVTAVNERSNHS